MFPGIPPVAPMASGLSLSSCGNIDAGTTNGAAVSEVMITKPGLVLKGPNTYQTPKSAFWLLLLVGGHGLELQDSPFRGLIYFQAAK